MAQIIASLIGIIGIIVVACVISLLMAFPVMWCWNAVIPFLFPFIPCLTWGKAWCLMFLSNMLLKSYSSK